MKLSELDMVFLSEWTERSFKEQETIEGAQGVMFLCPACHRHQVLCWFRNPINAPCVPAHAEPGPGRWTVSGTTAQDLTLHPSVNLDSGGAGCKWHGWVKDGDAT